MSPVTLPGDIPGLLRRCSPLITRPGFVCISTAPVAPTDEDARFVDGPLVALAGWEPEEPGEVWVLCEEEGDVVRVPLDAVALDLSDPTGQVHAAWWALERVPRVERLRDAAMGTLLATGSVGDLDRAGQERLRDLVLRLAGRSA